MYSFFLALLKLNSHCLKSIVESHILLRGHVVDLVSNVLNIIGFWLVSNMGLESLDILVQLLDVLGCGNDVVNRGICLLIDLTFVLFNVLKHFLKCLRSGVSMLLEIVLQGLKSVSQVFNVCPVSVHFSSSDHHEDLLVVREIFVVEVSVISEQEAGEV